MQSWWAKFQQGNEVIQGMNFTMEALIQTLIEFEEKAKKVKILSKEWLMNQDQQLGVYRDHREGISRMLE